MNLTTNLDSLVPSDAADLLAVAQMFEWYSRIHALGDECDVWGDEVWATENWPDGVMGTVATMRAIVGSKRNTKLHKAMREEDGRWRVLASTLASTSSLIMEKLDGE